MNAEILSNVILTAQHKAYSRIVPVSRPLLLALVAAFAAIPSFPQSAAGSGKSEESPKTRIGVPYGDFALLVNLKDWQQAENRGGSILFRQRSGDGYAMVITEPGVVPNGLDGLKSVILTNTRNNVPDLKVTLEDKRMVSGHPVLVLRMEGTITGVPLRYLTNSFSGTSGTILMLTYSSKDTFDKNLPMFTDFLSGLEINESASVANDSGQLSLESGKATINFDKSSWKVQSSGFGRFVLAHSSDQLYAGVITEALTFPLDSLSDIALANMKREGPDAKVTFRGKVLVNGKEMIQMNVDATVQGMPFSYQNYYYSGKAGSFQIMTWTKKGDSSKYQKEITDFINGFHVTE
jgi:hypothetical protein